MVPVSALCTASRLLRDIHSPQALVLLPTRTQKSSASRIPKAMLGPFEFSNLKTIIPIIFDDMNIQEETVGALVAADYRKAQVFKQFGIDFCCGGGRTVKEACEKKGVSLGELEDELNKIQAKDQSAEPTNFNEWDPRLLVEYILYTHHTYVRDNIPLLKEFTKKVARVHGQANPEVVEIAERFDEVAGELEDHMMKEERILFPYIKQLADARGQQEALDKPPFGTVNNPIRMMELEHEHAGEILAEIRRLSNDYTPPDHACTTYKVSYFKLEEFEADLHKHIHLENNILFPKAKSIEQESMVS